MTNYHRFLALFICGWAGLMPFHAVSANVLRDSVVEVLDGGTITVDVDKRLVRVRLCTVTSPLKDHPLAEISAFHLASLVKGKQIAIDYRGFDQDGTIAGIVTLADSDIGMQMVRDGAASYNRSCDNIMIEQSRRLYEESEQAARRELRGVWQQVAPSLVNQGRKPDTGQSSNVAKSAEDEARRLNEEAYSLIQEGNYRAALPKSRMVVRLDPNLAEGHKNLALVFCELERYAEALAECREAIRLKPDLDKAHNVLGKILYGMHDYKGSVTAYQEAIRLNPRYAKAHFNLGVSLTELGEFKRALTAYLEADTLAPNQPIVKLNTGWVLYKLGRRAEGRALWKKVLSMGDPAAALLAEGNLTRLP